MKGKQIARMFESIPKFDTYSHYNSTLEKLFKSNSLKTLIETLKRQKDINEISLLDQISKVNTDEPIDIYADEDSDLKKIQNEEEYDIFDEENDEKEHVGNKKEEKINSVSWRANPTEIKKKKLKPQLDPFKYHPNYNSIYKNVPCVRIIDPKKSLSKMDAKAKIRKKKSKEKSQENSPKKHIITETNNIILNKTQLKNKKSLNTISNIKSSDNSKNKNDLKLPKLIKLTNNKIMDSINSDSQNHALRFSKYIPRKFYIHENNKIVSYLEPFNYIKSKSQTKSIDFDKMLHRSEKNMVYASRLKNPSFGQYNPKYTYIDKNETVRLFNPEEKDLLSRKKYLMKKLWASYNVNTQYELVDNNKINN